MSLVLLNNISKSFGAQEVLQPSTLEINAGSTIGLVGRNGVGKTTLLRMIAKQSKPTTGHLAFMPGIQVGFLEQDPQYPLGRTLYDEVREGIAALDSLETELRRLEILLAKPELQDDEKSYQRILDKYALTQEHFEMKDGWRANSRVEAILDGLKVPRHDWQRDVTTFSGGERNIIGLARLLVQNPDVMLLDEPGNHLDFEGLDWLEQELKSFDGAIVIVSHNRYLLDSVCTSTWEVDKGLVEIYHGNYSAYRAEKLMVMERAAAAQKRQQREADRLKFQLQRLKSWASVYDNPKLARTAKRFEKRVENLESGEVKREDRRKIGITFGGEKTKGDIALDVLNYTRGFGSAAPLFNDVSFLIGQGHRTALVGPNGSGKSTFLKDVYNYGKWESEHLRVGTAMKVGYLSQMGEELEHKNTLIMEMIRLGSLRRNEAEGILYRFLFERDDFEKLVTVLSGGERVRLQLAALMASGSNFLLLDEPTNHLDVFSREAVEDALEAFQGTLLLVSHDRYFLDKLADRVFYLKNAKVQPFEGNFSEFWESWKDIKNQKVEEETLAIKRAKNEKKSRSEQKYRKIKYNAQRFEYLENEIARLEEYKEKLLAEIDKEKQKGNSKREAVKRESLLKTEDALVIIFEEWFAMGDKKKKF
jgi:ATP-binding cassette, subfamily F, member 3